MADSETGWTVLVPGDPGQLTGGYGYVRQIVSGLRHLGQPVTLEGLPGQFPRVDRKAQDALESALSAMPDGATVIVDGLVLGGCPGPAERHGDRLELIALVHHPLADEAGLGVDDQRHFFATEQRSLAAAGKVITTSGTTARGLSRYGVAAERIRVVRPGVHRPPPSTVSSRELQPLRILCLAHLSPRKAQHQLVEALAQLPARGWYCELAGSLDRAPVYARNVSRRVGDLGLSDRIRLTGELSGPALEQAFRRANLFVLPSLHEGYGMVIDEALGHGLPVVSSDGGALAETANRRGCVRYSAGDIHGLARLLQQRLEQPEVLGDQQQAARSSARELRTWAQAAWEFQQAVAKELPAGSDFDERWLALREPADHEARAPALDEQLRQWLKQQGRQAPVIADIGTGTGSNWRYLSRVLADSAINQAQWHLFDQDPGLLPGPHATVPGVNLHIARLDADNLDRHLPRPLDLLTASALIDLVSRPWLDAFTAAAAARNAAVLVVLSYEGDFRLMPVHRDDHRLRQLVNDHQHGDKGTGAACGPEATDYLASCLEARNYRVICEPSQWRLDRTHAALQRLLMQGWIEAARAQLALDEASNDSDWLDQWLRLRQRQAQQGELTIEVDHMDLLGLPPS